jgi:hypothetical protein
MLELEVDSMVGRLLRQIVFFNLEPDFLFRKDRIAWIFLFALTSNTKINSQTFADVFGLFLPLKVTIFIKSSNAN